MSKASAHPGDRIDDDRSAVGWLDRFAVVQTEDLFTPGQRSKEKRGDCDSEVPSR
jgi:hypothetical protein